MTAVKLLRHQLDGLAQVSDNPNCALYWDMGLGKTFGGSEQLMRYGSLVNLVVCQKSKVNDWLAHFRDHYSAQMLVYDLTAKAELEKFISDLVEGLPGMKVAVINYELAWRRPQLLSLRAFTLMLDESSLIQNRTAKQTRFVLKLRPQHVILLSGTPTAGKYENLWTQAKLLGWGISRELYDSQYVNWTTINVGGIIHRVVDKSNPYKNVDRLKRKLREHGAVFMKTEEVYDLPEQTFTEVDVPKTKEYRRFIKARYVELSDGTELIGDQTFTKRLYSRQLCGQYCSPKLDAFQALLESTNDRLIVFYNFNAELAALTQICESCGRPVSQINGSVKDLTAYETCEDSVTLIQYQAGAMGLNLQLANKMVYYTLPERSDLFEQSKARIHRIGQTRPCFYWILMCSGSVEGYIYKALKERKDYTDELFVQDHIC